MILSSNGTILTNFHVIQAFVGGRGGWGGRGGQGDERRVPIALSDGRCFDARLVAFDQNFDVLYFILFLFLPTPFSSDGRDH